MNSKSKKNKLLQKNSLKKFQDSDICLVSRASTEIMLYRFCKGKKIDFPFS